MKAVCEETWKSPLRNFKFILCDLELAKTAKDLQFWNMDFGFSTLLRIQLLKRKPFSKCFSKGKNVATFSSSTLFSAPFHKRAKDMVSPLFTSCWSKAGLYCCASALFRLLPGLLHPTLLITARPWWILITCFQWAPSVSLTIWIPAPPSTSWNINTY